MKKLALVGCLVSVMAFAADPKAAPPAAAPADKGMGMMEGWTPRKVTKEDKAGVQASMDAEHKAMMAGNLDEAMANMDFPVFMMTDDKDGVVMTTMVDAATYKKMMEPSVKAMSENKEMAAAMAKMPKPKFDMFFLTDTMAVVTMKGQMPMGKEKMEMRNSTIMINKGGKWMGKGMMEGGWGDMSKKMMMDEKKAMDMKGTEMKPAAGAPAGGPPKGSK